MKPILYKINTFDATKDNVFKFEWDGNQSFGNICTISTNDTKPIVTYSMPETTMRLEHHIPANTLINGKWYNVKIISIDIDNNKSVESDSMVFLCLSTPILSFTNIPDNAVLKNSTYRVTMSYSQVENELLESYTIDLYDRSKNLIQTSGVVYSANNLNYTLTNLEDDKEYYLKGTCYTVNGMSGETDYIPISVNYEQPDYYSILTLENIKNSGCIKLQSNIRVVECSVNGTPLYINDEYIDLTNNILSVDKDYALDSDYIIKFSGYNLINGLIMQIGNIRIYLVTENNASYLELYSPILNTYYYCHSNHLANLNSSEIVEIVIVKKQGIFGLSFNRK